MADKDRARRQADQALVASPSSPQAVSTEGFDPSRVKALLAAVAPICSVIADYVTNPGPTHEPHDRILGRIGRNSEAPPHVTWGGLCAIEEAAYALVSGIEAAEFALDAIATEAGTAATVKQGAVHEGAGPQDIAQPPSGDPQ